MDKGMQSVKTSTAEIKSPLGTTNHFKFHFALLDHNSLQNFIEYLSFDIENSVGMDIHDPAAKLLTKSYHTLRALSKYPLSLTGLGHKSPL